MWKASDETCLKACKNKPVDACKKADHCKWRASDETCIIKDGGEGCKNKPEDKCDEDENCEWGVKDGEETCLKIK